jgi:hypothetical protein
MSHCAFFEAWNLRISGTEKIFQKSRTHLQILGARRVTCRQTPYRGATNTCISRRCNKSSQHGDQVPTICSSLHVNNKEQFCSYLTVNTAGVQYKQWLHNVVSRNNRCFLHEACEMCTFTVAKCLNANIKEQQNAVNPTPKRRDRCRIKKMSDYQTVHVLT